MTDVQQVHPCKESRKKCLQKGMVQVRFRKTSLATILDKIDENLYPRPSPPKPTKDGKMAGFGFARLHP